MTAGFHDPLVAFISGDLLMRDGDPIAVDEDLLLNGLLDSIAVMRLVAHIESELHISVPPEDVTLENFSSVAAIAGYLDTRSG